jgi:hypothetical protein
MNLKIGDSETPKSRITAILECENSRPQVLNRLPRRPDRGVSGWKKPPFGTYTGGHQPSKVRHYRESPPSTTGSFVSRTIS